MKSFHRFILAILVASALVGGCGVLGCAGVGGNGGFAAGCGAGVRF